MFVLSKLWNFALFSSFVLSVADAAPPTNSTWDFIIVGSGPAGIVLADRLSESNKTVLLIERGFASSGRWGGKLRPAWLQGTNLTRFDVPAAYQHIWNSTDPENARIFCPDYTAPASCVLGGGTAINAGLFWRPTKDDWDPFPISWDYITTTPAVDRAFDKISWTDTPSTDGKSYYQDGPNLMAKTLQNAVPPYYRLRANDHADGKNRVFSKSEHFFINGERGGPLATYLVSASERGNFKLIMNSTVTRVVRQGDTITGVEIESSGPDGYLGVVGVKNGTGRVVLSAGVWGTSKILFRSGIGPHDQLSLLKNSSSESSKLPAEKDWITLPVGQQLDDAPAINLAVSVPNITAYDSEKAFSDPIQADKESYLKNRTGPLAQIAPPMGPVFWDRLWSGTNQSRYLQWTVGTDNWPGTGSVITFFGTLNLGGASTGRLTLFPNLTMTPTTLPYFNDPESKDLEAVLLSASDVLTTMQSIPNTTVLLPPANVTLESYVRSQITKGLQISANHWVGSAQMRESCGEAGAVVDARAKVCGTRNLFVVDAGVVNRVPVSNPVGLVVSVAERVGEMLGQS